MGSTNFGGQVKTVEWNADAADYSFNKRFLNIFPTGIYKGGLLKLISTTAFNLTSLVCEIIDHNGQYQVRVATTTDEQFTPDSATPYVVLRWQYTGVTGQNYMDVFLTATPDIYLNRLIVGKCLFSGTDLIDFSYGESDTYKRSVPDLSEHNFKALGNTGITFDGRDMWFSGGRIPNINVGGEITATLDVDVRKVTFPVEATEKTYYVYLDRSLNPTYPQINTSYLTGKQYIIIAKVTVPLGSDPVTLDMVTDRKRYIW